MVEEVFDLASRRQGAYVCCANVHMLVEAWRRPELQKVLNEADLATPDGMPIAKCVAAAKGSHQDRVAGMDLIASLLAEAAARGASVFFLGDTEDTLQRLSQRALLENDGLKIAGCYAPPFRSLDEQEERKLIDQINQVAPDLLFVALGCPRQELWMARQRPHIHSCMLGVGNAFRTYAGLSKRAPVWMQKASLEWLHRLLSEPGRLWKRYLVTNSLFVGYLIQARLRRSKGL